MFLITITGIGEPEPRLDNAKSGKGKGNLRGELG